MNAGDLAAHYDVSKPTMSTHFAALKDADLIAAKREGVSIYYQLNATVAEEAMTAVMEMLDVGKAPESANASITPHKELST